MASEFTIILIGLLVLVFLFVFFSLIPVFLWINAVFAGVKLSLASLVGMRLRKVPPAVIVRALITSIKAGINISTNDLETHFLSGGNVQRVVDALIAADKANIDLNFQKACGIDLAGRNILEAIQTSVNPRVINVPDTSNSKIGAVAKDGIQLYANARVTVRTNIKTLVGGATEDTIIARVGEGIVSAIGSAETYKEVLENPDNITKRVLDRGLDSGTAYTILSIDIGDVDVGKNVGADLQAEQARSDLKVAQAKAETKRAQAVAREQEMQARVVEMRAKVVEAEARIPEAMADAFRKGNLGIMDYYKMQNIKSDTNMREYLAKEDFDSSSLSED